MNATVKRQQLDSVIIRFAGDSGDGMQLTGKQFTQSTGIMGNDLATFPDFPAEIRAPAGTTYGVSAFQIHFANHEILTPGDAPDVLVAMNPAALITQLEDLKDRGLVVVNSGAFSPHNLKKAGYSENPLEDGTLDGYRSIVIDISKHTMDSVSEFGLSNKESLRSKNMWTLGLLMWLYGRDRSPTVDFLETKFKKIPKVAQANVAALNAGHIYGETAELPHGIEPYEIPSAPMGKGMYRNISGSEGTAWGLVAGCQLADVDLFYGSYPITPASPILHILSGLKRFGVVTFQAEDEIAAVCSAVGASFAGNLGITASSGPGIALKMEGIGLAVACELPLVVVSVQRGGPSTGLPTKTEQSDLMQALYGRNGDAPLVVISASSPGDCFEVAIEAVRIATHYMTPVILMTDGYLANGSEPWLIPSLSDYEPFPVKRRTDPEAFHPFARDERLIRPWAVPGTPGLEHRIGGLERDYDSGHVSYDADNHQEMTRVRRDRIARIAEDLPEQALVHGDESDELLVVGWGSTYGAIYQAVSRSRAKGLKVAHVHLRYIHPFARGLKRILASFDNILVPELNDGQLVTVLRGDFLVPAEGISKVNGKPYMVGELEDAIARQLDAKGDREERADDGPS